MMYFSNNGTLVISDKVKNSDYKLAAVGKIENLLEHGGARLPHIVKTNRLRNVYACFKANDYAWKKISQVETHFNKMKESSHVIELINQFR